MTTQVTVQGHCDERFATVRQAFEANFAQHGDIGASFAVAINGQMVIDLWGGAANRSGSKAWQRDTIVNVWSVTKALVAVCALRLVDQGKLALDAPVYRYWPEFAAAGKEEVLVRHLLSHQAGLAAISQPLPTAALFDWQRMTAALVAQKPWWRPGSGFGYHAATFGWLVGELVRRVSGKSIGAFLRDEIAEPLGIDFLLGFGPQEDYRVAEAIFPPPTEKAPPAEEKEQQSDPALIQAHLDNPPAGDPAIFNSRAWRAVEIPAANGTTNARALARFYGVLACGGALAGYQLLSPQVLAAATTEVAGGKDLVYGNQASIGLGFLLNNPPGYMGPNRQAFGHSGYGGSLGFADPQTKLSFGYTVNYIDGAHGDDDPRIKNVRDALYAAL